METEQMRMTFAFLSLFLLTACDVPIVPLI